MRILVSLLFTAALPQLLAAQTIFLHLATCALTPTPNIAATMSMKMGFFQ